MQRAVKILKESQSTRVQGLFRPMNMTFLDFFFRKVVFLLLADVMELLKTI